MYATRRRSDNQLMRIFSCCGNRMMMAPSVSADGIPQITSVCLTCELRLVNVPVQRSSSERDDESPARFLKYRQGIVLQRPWHERTEVRAEPFSPAGRFARAATR
jgi:hypothetical protein